MKCTHPYRGIGGNLGNAGSHFVGRLVGKRQGQDLVPAHSLFQQVGNSVCDHPGLAASGAGQNQQGSLDVLHGEAL